nr:hypothetical protein [Dyella sp. ASV24]
MEVARRLVVLAAITWMVCQGTANAVQVSDNLDLGGAIRVRADEDGSRGIHEIGFDTLMLSAKYDSDSWEGAARYRYYGNHYPFQYMQQFGNLQFMEYAWIGYKFDPGRQLQVGLNKVPFGLQPLYSDTFYETLGNVLGLEDLWELGAKYVQAGERWNFQGGYYARPAPPGHGSSNGTTYSIVPTPADSYVDGGSRNVERDMVMARLARTATLGGWTGEVGASALVSKLYNRDTGQNGHRVAYAVHYAAANGPWSTKLQYTRIQMSPRNPLDNSTVSYGGYDGTFNVASRGNLYIGSLSYAWPGSYLGGWFSGVKTYASYNYYEKSQRSFNDSQRFILGTSFSLKKLWIAVEWQNGRNDPYFGGSSYTQSLAAGGTDHWTGQFYMNIGYYF